MRTSLMISVFMAVVWVGGAQAQPDTLWTKILSDPEHGQVALGAVETSDHGLCIVGNKYGQAESSFDMYVVKTDSCGDQEWDRSFVAPGDGFALSVVEMPNSDLIVSGSLERKVGDSRRYAVLSLNHDGDSLWSIVSEEGDNSEIVRSCLATDGNLVLAVLARGGDYGLMKIDPDGELIWYKIYGEQGFDEVCDLALRTGGGFALGGFSNSFGNSMQFYLLTVDTAGREEWAQVYGDDRTQYGLGVVQTPDGGYAICGTGGWGDLDFSRTILVRTDSLGNELWSKAYGSRRMDPQIEGMLQLPDGGFVIAGSARTVDYEDKGVDMYLLRINKDGDSLWTGFYRLPWVDTDSYRDECNKILAMEDGGYLLIGHTDSGSGIAIVRTAPDPANGVSSGQPINPAEFTLYPAFPNPFNSTTVVGWRSAVDGWASLRLYDIGGRLLETLADGWQRAGEHRVMIDANGQAGTPVLPAGCYTLLLQAGTPGHSAARTVSLIK